MHARFVALSAAAALTLGATAHAATVATFADPASGPGTPLFTLTGNVLSGGWSGLGLTLQTPGTPAPDYTNVTFRMTPLNVIPLFGGFSMTNGGVVTFFDSAANPILNITFSAGFLTSPSGVGASDFNSQNVAFSGAALGGLLPSDEAFSFSFANPVALPQGAGYTVTSAFTSSATLDIPGPVSLAGLGMGLLVAGRRRRA